MCLYLHNEGTPTLLGWPSQYSLRQRRPGHLSNCQCLRWAQEALQSCRPLGTVLTPLLRDNADYEVRLRQEDLAIPYPNATTRASECPMKCWLQPGTVGRNDYPLVAEPASPWAHHQVWAHWLLSADVRQQSGGDHYPGEGASYRMNVGGGWPIEQ